IIHKLCLWRAPAGEITSEFRDTIDIDIKLIPEETGCGGVRAGFKGFVEKRAEERKRSRYASSEFMHPIHQMFEIGQIARIGIALRPKRIERGKDPPGSLPPGGDREKRFGRGGDDESRPAVD